MLKSMIASWTAYLLLLTLVSVSAIQMMFDQLRHCTSNGMIECNVRVRKINRTVAALYGNATLKVALGDSFVVSVNYWYLCILCYRIHFLRCQPVHITALWETISTIYTH